MNSSRNPGRYFFSRVAVLLTILVMLITQMQAQPVLAQNGKGDGLERQVNAETGRLSFITAEGGQPLSAARAFGEMSIRPQDPALALATRYGPEFGLKDPQSELAAAKSEQGEDGRLTVRYQQEYQEIPVMGGELIVNTNDQGDLYSINGEVSPDLSVSTQAEITAEAARQAALDGMAQWYKRPAEEFVSTEPALWVYDESLLKESTRPVELVWRMEVTASDAGMPVRELVLVSAQNGSVTLHFNQVDTAWKAAAGPDQAPMAAPEPRETPIPAEPLFMDGSRQPTAEKSSTTARTSGLQVDNLQSADLGVTLYVATTGNDSNTCLLAALPCSTIAGAIGKAQSGDTIKVASGTYTGTGSQVIMIGTSLYISGGWDSGFTIQSGVSTIDGQNARQGVFTYGDSTVVVTLERFAIINGFVDAGGNGGGILNNGNTLNLNNVTLSNNIAYYGYGGGVYNLGISNLNNVTLSNNDAGFGGGIYNSSHTVTLTNTLVGGNTSHGNNAASGPDCLGTISASYFSLIGDTTDCQVVSGQGNLLNINPRLGAFDSTGKYYPLMSGSAAIDGGSPAIPGSGGNACLAVDQRGAARPLGTRCDIGAYEGSVPWMPMAYVDTYTAQNYFLLPGAFLCNQNDPNCAYGDSDAKSVHTYAIGIYNFYLDKFSRDSIDNAGMTIKSAVHYCDEDPDNPGSAICPYDNAYWTGSQILYGDAYGYALADDVAAHEYTHGVTQYESALLYYYQSGAINESISDVFGEYYDQVGNVTPGDTAAVKWLIEEDVTGWGAVRSMKDPTSYGDPDWMGSSYYYTGADDNGGVHWNSGVNNKAAYLMVDGGTFRSTTVTPLGWEKVGAIYYEANTNLLTAAADYSDLYLALQQACTNLVGKKNITIGDCEQVKNALDAVGMNTSQQPGDFADPGFELYTVNPYWWEYSDQVYTPLCKVGVCSSDGGTAGPRTGSAWALLGTKADERAFVAQDVYFPDGSVSLKLKFYLWIGRADAGSDIYDKFEVDVDNVPVFTADATQKSSYASYTPVIVDLSGFDTNVLHFIKFSSKTTGQIVHFNLDDVSLYDDSLMVSGNAGVAGAVLQYVVKRPQSVTADAGGNYSLAVPRGWSGTIAPSLSHYSFSPASRTYSNLVASQTGQNYTATRISNDIYGNTGIGALRSATPTRHPKQSQAIQMVLIYYKYPITGVEKLPPHIPAPRSLPASPTIPTLPQIKPDKTTRRR
jgi:Zn-dependent metalloprotease